MSLLLFDIGGTAVKYGIWDEDTLKETSQFNTPKNWEELEIALLNIYTQFKEIYQISGISLSAPGAVDTLKGEIGGISAVPYVHGFKIVERLEKVFKLPIAIENDANCAALAEVFVGAAKDVSNSIFLIIGSGIGGAVVIDKKLVKGPQLFGGEFGYILMNNDKTLSTLASPVVVAKQFSEEHLNGKEFSGKDLFALYESEDINAVKAVDEMFTSLALGIFNLSVSLNPELVLIGGGLSNRSDLLDLLIPKIEKIKKQVNAHDLKIPLKICQFTSEANLIGAMANFNENYK